MLIRLLATSVFSSLPALALLQAMVSLGKRGACPLPAASTTQYAADRSLWLRTGPCLQGGGRKKKRLLPLWSDQHWLSALADRWGDAGKQSYWHPNSWFLRRDVSSYELLLHLRHQANLTSASSSSLPPKAGHIFIKYMDSPSDWVPWEEKQVFLSLLELSELSVWRCVSNSREGSLELLYFVFYSPFEDLLALYNPCKFSMAFLEVVSVPLHVTYLLNCGI